MKTSKNFFTVVLAFAMAVLVLPSVFSETCIDASAAKLRVGDIVEFGSYPQTQVEDKALISKLNSITDVRTVYWYYSGDGSWNNGSAVPGSWMTYDDVTYNGQEYRGVKFVEYRPDMTAFENNANVSNQDENGYYVNTVYWFRYEPLKWKVLDPKSGLVLCQNIIDAQPFNNDFFSAEVEEEDWGSVDYKYTDSSCEYYLNNYAESSLRHWLNDDFYNIAFSKKDKAAINTTLCDNSSPWCAKYECEDTYDNVFLLSFDDVCNEDYGFSPRESTEDSRRRTTPTDYALSQGYFTSDTFGNSWILRSPFDEGITYSDYIMEVFGTGWVGSGLTANSVTGIRPAITVDLSSDRVSVYTEKTTVKNNITTKPASKPATKKPSVKEEVSVTDVTEITTEKVTQVSEEHTKDKTDSEDAAAVSQVKKSENTKMYIFIGAGVVVVILSIIAVVVYSKKKSR